MEASQAVAVQTADRFQARIREVTASARTESARPSTVLAEPLAPGAPALTGNPVETAAAVNTVAAIPEPPGPPVTDGRLPPLRADAGAPETGLSESATAPLIGAGESSGRSVASVSATAAASPARPQDAETRIRRALASFREAYSTLDAEAAGRVWPGVEQRALARAFAGLKSQQLEFERCDVDVRGASAAASCLGRAVIVRRVGSQEPQVERRHWAFTLKEGPAGWTIQRTQVR
jgi:hypothetical protein